MLCLLYYAYVISSTNLVMRAKQDLPGNEQGERGERAESGGRMEK
jgi:hypothetical protein